MVSWDAHGSRASLTLRVAGLALMAALFVAAGDARASGQYADVDAQFQDSEYAARNVFAPCCMSALVPFQVASLFRNRLSAHGITSVLTAAAIGLAVGGPVGTALGVAVGTLLLWSVARENSRSLVYGEQNGFVAGFGNLGVLPQVLGLVLLFGPIVFGAVVGGVGGTILSVYILPVSSNAAAAQERILERQSATELPPKLDALARVGVVRH